MHPQDAVGCSAPLLHIASSTAEAAVTGPTSMQHHSSRLSLGNLIPGHPWANSGTLSAQQLGQTSVQGFTSNFTAIEGSTGGTISSTNQHSPPTSQFMDITQQPSQTQIYPGILLSALPIQPSAAVAVEPTQPLVTAAAAAATALQASLAIAATPPVSFVAAAAANLKLVLTHQCRATGCANRSCLLCQHNTSRACTSHLKPKYISKDLLTAKCGGPLCVAVVAGEASHVLEDMNGLEIKMCLINAPKYRETRAADEHIQGLVTTGHLPGLVIDKPLLKWGVGAETTHVTRSLQGGMRQLSELRCLCVHGENQSGKASEFKLLVYVPGRNDVTPLVSDTFTVVTTRSKGAVKADIPTVTDPVKVLEGIGDQALVTLAELQDRLEYDLPDHLKAVTQVGQLLDLMKLLEAQPALSSEMRCKKLFKPVDLQRAATHAATAVHPDYRPRVWWAPESLVQQQQQQQWGVLFHCRLGAVQLDQPLAAVHRPAAAIGAGDQGLHNPAADDVIPLIKGISDQIRDIAQQAWNSEGHGSWEIYWGDASDPFAARAFGPGSQQEQQQQQQKWPHGVLRAAGCPAAAAGEFSAAVAGAAGPSASVYASSRQQQQQLLPDSVKPGQPTKQQQSTVLQLLLQKQQYKQQEQQQQQQQQQRQQPPAPATPSPSHVFSTPQLILSPPLPLQQQQSPSVQQYVPGPLFTPASFPAAAAAGSSAGPPAVVFPVRSVTWPPITGFDTAAAANHMMQQQQQYIATICSSDLGQLLSLSGSLGQYLTRLKSEQSVDLRSLDLRSLDSAAAAASNPSLAPSGSDSQRYPALDIARLQTDDIMLTDSGFLAEVNRQFSQRHPGAFEQSMSI